MFLFALLTAVLAGLAATLLVTQPWQVPSDAGPAPSGTAPTSTLPTAPVVTPTAAWLEPLDCGKLIGLLRTRGWSVMQVHSERRESCTVTMNVRDTPLVYVFVSATHYQGVIGAEALARYRELAIAVADIPDNQVLVIASYYPTDLSASEQLLAALLNP